MKSDAVAGREAVQHALSDRAASVKALLDADFTAFDTAELLGLLSEREQYARADTAVDHRILAALMDRATPHEIGGKTWTDILATRDRISATEARQRITAARDLGPRHTMTGEVLEPVLAACAAALAAGKITTGHIAIIGATLNKASAYLDATARGQLESTLVDIATTNTPETLQKAADHVLALINPDGQGPDPARHRRGLSISAQDPDGMAKVTGWVDAELAAYLRTILHVWARPGINNPDDPAPQHNPDPHPLEGESVEPDTEPEPEAEGPGTAQSPPTWDLDPPAGDHRSQPQRNHDALKAVLRDTLMSIRLAEHAHHYLIVYRHHTAEPLYMGRTKRLATTAQRLLLYNRDRGCTRPGCTQAACRCQTHHANPSWNNGGLTDAPDLGLGCGPDNQLAELGWTNTIDPETGRVHWHPPLPPRRTPPTTRRR